MPWVLGTDLTEDDQRYVLAAFVYRYTGANKPGWVHRHKVQFADDAEWLANTRFRTRADGRLDRRSRYCMSNPTWPNGAPKNWIGSLARAQTA